MSTTETRLADLTAGARIVTSRGAVEVTDVADFDSQHIRVTIADGAQIIGARDYAVEVVAETPAPLHPDYAAAALAVVAERSLKHRQAVELADADRRERDKAIKRAADDGLGIREIARAGALDPSLVSRIVRSA